MGTVWSARDEVLGRKVAIKEVLPPPHLSATELDELRRRILQEARAAARIGSTAAVIVYDVVEEGDRPWIVMELLAPRTLQDVLAQRRLRPVEAAALGLNVLAALRAADAAGVLHRDVKPGNVMFRGTGDDVARAVLTDFGIARFVGDPSATATGTVIGSPAYVAPERATGGPATLTSDLWSLGITLWTAVEGSSPFHRDGAPPTLTAIVTEDVPPAPHAGALRPVLDGLLRKDPEERLSVLQVEESLRAVASGRPVPTDSAARSTAVLDVVDRGPGPRGSASDDTAPHGTVLDSAPRGTAPRGTVPADATPPARRPPRRVPVRPAGLPEPSPDPGRPRRGRVLLAVLGAVAAALLALVLVQAVGGTDGADGDQPVADEAEGGSAEGGAGGAPATTTPAADPDASASTPAPAAPPPNRPTPHRPSPTGSGCTRTTRASWSRCRRTGRRAAPTRASASATPPPGPRCWWPRPTSRSPTRSPTGRTRRPRCRDGSRTTSSSARSRAPSGAAGRRPTGSSPTPRTAPPCTP